MLAEIFGMDAIVVVVVVVAVLFGGSQIPKLARSLGSARHEFSEGLREGGGGSQPNATDATKAPPA